MTRDIYLALGDSITAGHGATHPGLSFVRHVSDYARKQAITKRTLVVARNGWTSRDIWSAALTLDTSIWQETELVTLMAGGNDLRRLLRRQFLSGSGAPITPTDIVARLQGFSFHMDRLCEFISRQQIPHVVVATVYNPVPNSALAVQAMEALNGVTRDIAENYHFPVVDVHGTFRSKEAYLIERYRSGHMEDLAMPIGRPIHPNNAGHLEIAKLFTAQLSQGGSSAKKRRVSAKAKTPRKSLQRG